MLQAPTIKFLKDLKKNNDKSWFDTHRTTYENAKADFAGFIQLLIDTHSKNDQSIDSLKARECMFRINRDVRFAKDKSPYKTNFGASINKGGKKSTLAGYYFHLEPGKSFAGGGMYAPMPDDLKKVRQEIDYNFNTFKKIINSKKFKSVFGRLDNSKEYTLSRVPKGYEIDNTAAEFIKLKSFIAFVPISDADLSSKNLVKKIVDSFEALNPLLNFLNAAIEE